MAQYDEEKLTKLSALKTLAEKVNQDYATKEELTTKTGDLQTKIEKIKVPTKVSELTDHASYATTEQLNAKVSAVYKPAGSTAFASLPEPAVGILGNVYNVTDGFTTDTKFIEGTGKAYPAGTNVVVVSDSSAYKYDVLSGIVDLTGYAKTETLTTELAKKAEKTHTHTTGDITDLTTKLSAYVTSTSLTSQLAGKAATGHNHTVSDITDLEMATDDEVTAMITEVFSPVE